MNGEVPQASRTVIDVREGEMSVQGRPLLRDVELRFGNVGVTVILGPAGTGKSNLLRALAGVRQQDGPSLSGSWKSAATRLSFLPQTRRTLIAGDHVAICDRPDQALRADVDAVMLDEPDRQVMPDGRPALVEQILQAGRRRLVVVVTHDLQLARQIADTVVFVCAGRVRHSCDAHTFFNEPPSHLVGQFLRQGNCWPAAEPVELPPHFQWVLPGKLGGMGRPGLMREVEEDLSALASRGVSLLVSLEEEAFSTAKLRSFGIQSRHLPIKDMGVPALGPTARLCGYMENHIAAGGVVVVHCRAGLGRTGTILASYLVWTGEPAELAIERVRSVQPMALQTRPQEAFVERFARDTGSVARGKTEVG